MDKAIETSRQAFSDGGKGCVPSVFHGKVSAHDRLASSQINDDAADALIWQGAAACHGLQPIRRNCSDESPEVARGNRGLTAAATLSGLTRGIELRLDLPGELN